MSIYDRQKELPLKIPKGVAVLGLGGVGSWVALNFALVGVPTLYLFDADLIEEHNLNRTPFKLEHIDFNKALAVSLLIRERRTNTKITVVPDFSEEYFIDELKENVEYVIDCRDNIRKNRLMEEFRRRYVKLGYDGKNATVHFNPDPDSVWGDEPVRYTVTPSYLVPPQFLANFITEVILSGKFPEEEKIISFNIEDLVEAVLDGCLGKR